MTWVHLPNLASSLATEASRLVLDSPAWIHEPSATLNGTPIVSKSSVSESQRATWMTLPFGTTSQPSTGSLGADTWILLLAVSRAKTSVLLGTEPGLTELEAVFGGRCLESFGKWDRDTSSLRTYQASFWEDKPVVSLESFPPSGTMRSGTAYRLRPLAPRTSVGGGGVSRYMTPNAMDSLEAKSQEALNHEHDTARPGRANPNNLRYQVAVSEGITMWPTPNTTRREWTNTEKATPTPTLLGMAKTGLWPTPRVSDHGNPGAHGQGGQDLRTEVGGQLNPTWVEWLMGLPIGWTALEALATESFQRWLQGFSPHNGHSKAGTAPPHPQGTEPG